MSARHVEFEIPSTVASDGAGVRIRRSIGLQPSARVDPFLMLDEFGSDNPDDYIAGFPSHPHRGFETVTYMLDGEMLHEDHMGNQGLLVSGGAQWMTAGRGIIHSEMPRLREGLMRGFQLWVNLPAKDKLRAPWYRDLAPHDIPEFDLADGVRTRIIAGTMKVGEAAYEGALLGIATDPLYADVQLDGGASITLSLPAGHRGFVYVFEGSVAVAGRAVQRSAAAVLSEGTSLVLSSDTDGSRCLLVLGRPLGEPIAQYGPFVMNTRAELEEAVRDYQAGRLTA
ncbi:MAG: pirin family protein [Pseudomonadota bacterium]